MFYIISKILAFLLSPIVWIVLLLFFSLIIKKKENKNKIIVFTILIFLLFSNEFILSQLKKSWELPPVLKSEITKEYDYGIVLGGLASKNEEHNIINFHEDGDRLFHALEFYYKGQIDKFLITGGSAKIINNEIKEADFLKNYLLNLNIPENDILIDNQSRNTYENAIYTSELIKNKTDTINFLLFTSAIHMRRALACFEKQNIICDYFPIDYSTDNKSFDLKYYIVPQSKVLENWQFFLHEIVGYYVYKLKKYI